MASRRQHPKRQNLPTDSEESQREESGVRDATSGRVSDGVHVPVDVSQAPKQTRIRKAARKQAGRKSKVSEVEAPAAPLPEPFASVGCNCNACPYSVGGKPKDFLLPERKRSPVG